MSTPLVIRLTRLSDERHRFAFTRADGSGGARELETRSLLLHDLAHYAVESEAKLLNGFYGALASGTELEGPMEELQGEALAIELVVAPMTTAFKEGRPPVEFATRLAGYFEQAGRTPPAWLDAALIERAFARLKMLMGRWKATPFGGEMELAFQG